MAKSRTHEVTATPAVQTPRDPAPLVGEPNVLDDDAVETAETKEYIVVTPGATIEGTVYEGGSEDETVWLTDDQHDAYQSRGIALEPVPTEEEKEKPAA